jgi:hypothetical protein
VSLSDSNGLWVGDDFGSDGWEFESLRARYIKQVLTCGVTLMKPSLMRGLQSFSSRCITDVSKRLLGTLSVSLGFQWS